MMDPEKLAAELIRALGDADSNTAHTALEIAKLLLIYRDTAARQFATETEHPSQSGLDSC